MRGNFIGPETCQERVLKLFVGPGPSSPCHHSNDTMFAKKVTQQIDKNPSAGIFPAVESASFTPDVGSWKLLQLRHALLSVGHSDRFSQGEALIRKKHQYLTCKLNFDVVGALALPEMPRITSKTAISKPKPGCSPYIACATSYQINSIPIVNSI